MSHFEPLLKGLELCQVLGVEKEDTDQNMKGIPTIETSKNPFSLLIIIYFVFHLIESFPIIIVVIIL